MFRSGFFYFKKNEERYLISNFNNSAKFVYPPIRALICLNWPRILVSIIFEPISIVKPPIKCGSILSASLICLAPVSTLSFSAIAFCCSADNWIEEVILATSSTVEGDATAMFIKDHIENIKVSRISYGIPIGGELEYVDGNTIARAIQGRTVVNVD